jgi:hypothetical protein
MNSSCYGSNWDSACTQPPHRSAPPALIHGISLSAVQRYGGGVGLDDGELYLAVAVQVTFL